MATPDRRGQILLVVGPLGKPANQKRVTTAPDRRGQILFVVGPLGKPANQKRASAASPVIGTCTKLHQAVAYYPGRTQFSGKESLNAV